jgi:hypothetical protein
LRHPAAHRALAVAGPPPWVFGIASELNAIANTLQEGGLRSGLQKVAGQVVAAGFGAK